MNYDRLGRAMGVSASYLYDMCFAWPIKHCQICGRVEIPGHRDEFYHTVIQERPAFICKDHFYTNQNTTEFDCLTGTEVELQKPVGFFRKAVNNALTESGYWCGVIAKYIWFTIRDIAMYATHPYKTFRCRKRYAEMGWEWKW